MNLPKDPVMLLSVINTQLRDHYPSLEELCASCDIEKTSLCAQLAVIDYTYDREKNQFV